MKDILEFWVCNANGAILFRKTDAINDEIVQYFGCFMSALDSFITEMGTERLLLYETPSFIYYFDYDDSCKMELIFVIKTMKNSQSREINQQKLIQFKTAFLERNCQKLRNWDGQIDIFGCSDEIIGTFQGDVSEK